MANTDIGGKTNMLIGILVKGQIPPAESWQHITLRQHERYYELRRVLPPGDAIRLALLEVE